MSKRCWANSLGDCSSMSGEHVFSNSIFTPGCDCPRLIEGVHRIRGGAPTRSAEKANILCAKHNSLLSPLDEVIGKVAAFQAAANEEAFEKSLYLEGELLERWLLKTVINIAAAGWIRPRKWLPSPPIVDAIFGKAEVPVELGLYSVNGVDPSHRPSGGVSFVPIVLKDPIDPQLAGAYLSVHGMPLLLSLSKNLARRLENGEAPELTNRFSPDGLRHLHHPGALVMSRARGKPVHIGLSWKGVLSFADGSTASFPRPKGEPLPPGIFDPSKA